MGKRVVGVLDSVFLESSTYFSIFFKQTKTKIRGVALVFVFYVFFLCFIA